ncbi:MAG: ATP-binding protein [Thermoguttaceae bacterium]
MKLPPEGARWLVSLRWIACASVFVVIWLTSSVLNVVSNPLPLYVVASAMVAYNLLFQLGQRRWASEQRDVERNILLQITFDLIALTLLLYFSNLSRNPFLMFFVFHMIIASMYLHGWTPYLVAAVASVLVGAVMAGEYLCWIPVYPMNFPTDQPGEQTLDGLYLVGVFAAFASTIWITVYFTTSIHHYVDRAHDELRQKEKMLGIGQLVAGIAHQIANPLDGIQNCLEHLGDRVKDDTHLTEYVQMMTEALDRIERTATRVQAFARPRGVTMQDTDVNVAVEGTLQVLGSGHGPNIKIETELEKVPTVRGDPYTLQEVLFNLCTNAMAAMPGGGTITLRSHTMGRLAGDQAGAVAIEVSDTGVGIPQTQLEKIFEPFFTTRAEQGGTGLGLGLCRMLISEMGGRIEVRSTLGEGTTFTVLLNPAENEITLPRQ